MHNASINEEVRWKTIKVVTTSSWFHCNNNMVLYDMHKKGFIDMVKGLLACLTKSSRSSNISGPTPSISSTSSTIVERNHNKQHNKAGNKSALKIWVGLFWDTSGHMRDDQSGFIRIWSMDISEHFNMMGSRGLWICKKCTEIYFWKMSKDTHLTKDDFRSI